MNWNDISVEQFMTISSFNINDFDNIDEFNINIYSYLEEKDLDYYYNLDYNEFEAVKEQFTFLNNIPAVSAKKELTFDNITLHQKEFLKISIGEFIDLESLIINWQDNVDKLCAIFYQLKINHNSLLEEDVFEEYTAQLKHRSKLFLDVKFIYVYSNILKFIEFRNWVYEVYAGLFDLNDDSIEDLESIEELDLRDKAAIIAEIKEKENLKKFSWDLVLYNLAKEDITKIEAVTRLNVIFVFNTLSMIKQCKLNK